MQRECLKQPGKEVNISPSNPTVLEKSKNRNESFFRYFIVKYHTCLEHFTYFYLVVKFLQRRLNSSFCINYGFNHIRMPKIARNRAFEMPVIIAQMRKWEKAAEELESVASVAYRKIRKYLPQFENDLSSKQRMDIFTKLSKCQNFSNLSFLLNKFRYL